MSGILNRISKIAENEKITITFLENKVGASKGVFSRALQKGTDIQSKWLTEIVANYPQYNAEWLLTGKGEMLKPTKDKAMEHVIDDSEIAYVSRGTDAFIDLLEKNIEDLRKTVAMLETTINDLRKDNELKSKEIERLSSLHYSKDVGLPSDDM